MLPEFIGYEVLKKVCKGDEKYERREGIDWTRTRNLTGTRGAELGRAVIFKPGSRCWRPDPELGQAHGPCLLTLPF